MRRPYQAYKLSNMRIFFNSLVLIQIMAAPILMASGGQSKMRPIFWPDAQLIPIQTAYSSALLDGLDIEITEFQNKAVPLFSTEMHTWKQIPRLTFRTASIAFSHTKNPSIRIGVSIVGTDRWLKEINTALLQSYVASIRLQHPERVTCLNEEEEFQPLGKSDFLIGHPYKMIHYTIEPKEDEKEEEKMPTMEIWDFICEHEEYTVIFSYECPQSLATKNFPNALSTMFSFTRVEELN